MKVISLWQPWASLIAVGEKRFETRSWPTSYRGPILIHAAKKWTSSQADLCRTTPYFECLDAGAALIPLGGIVAVGELVECRRTAAGRWKDGGARHEELFGDWLPGRFAWRIDGVRAIDPIPFSGRQGLFDAPADLVDQVEQQLRSPRVVEGGIR